MSQQYSDGIMFVIVIQTLCKVSGKEETLAKSIVMSQIDEDPNKKLSKLQCIKIFKDQTNWGLIECKIIIDEAIYQLGV